MARPHVLVLGGTGDARLLARRLVGHDLRVALSLAGRTAEPLPQAGEVRSGGFGGVEGLKTFLREKEIDLLVDATHPFAAGISVNAEAAAHATGVRLVVLERPPWVRSEGDRWLPAKDMGEAAALLGESPRRAFLAIGRQELDAFRDHPQHAYLVRSVDPVAEDVLPGARFVLGRGPFDEAAEHRLLQEHGIDILVAKNSGGAATYGKIAAARALGLPVVMIGRPRASREGAAASVDEAFAKILHALGPFPHERGA